MSESDRLDIAAIMRQLPHQVSFLVGGSSLGMRRRTTLPGAQECDR